MGLAQWMRAADAIANLAQLSGKFRRPETPAAGVDPAQASSTPPQQPETRLAGVLVAALKEAFDRDRSRMELERAQLDAERQRAEDALRAELRRQVVDRALDRTRIVVVLTIAVWMLSAILAAWMPGMRNPVSKWLLGGGWMCAVGAVAAALSVWRDLSSGLAVSAARADGPRFAETAMSGLLLAAIVLCGAAVLHAL